MLCCALPLAVSSRSHLQLSLASSGLGLLLGELEWISILFVYRRQASPAGPLVPVAGALGAFAADKV